MTLTNDVNTRRRNGDQVADPVAADTIIYAGSMYSLDSSGNAVPAGSATALKVRAVAESRADNTGGLAGAISVSGRRGFFAFKNSGTSAIARSDIGATCYAQDEITVAKADGGTLKVAGTILDAEVKFIWVQVG